MTVRESRLIFTRSEAWVGGSYELAIELGERDDESLCAARRAVWAFSDLDGCYLDLTKEPAEQKQIDPDESLAAGTTLRGVAQIGSAAPVACSTIVVREDEGSDWIYFGVPMGSLGSVFPAGAFPFEDGGDLSWTRTVDEWLCRLARHVYATVRFRLGLVGWTDGLDGGADELLRDGVPRERWCGYLAPDDEFLRWHPSNQRAPFSVGGR